MAQNIKFGDVDVELPSFDFNKFGIEDYTDDMVNLMVRRVYDIAGTTDKTLNVYYNQERLKVKSFDKYIELYNGNNSYVCEKIHPRWELGISVSQKDKFEQYSFANGIYTSKGGKHVDLIVKQLTNKISTSIQNLFTKLCFINFLIIAPSKSLKPH